MDVSRESQNQKAFRNFSAFVVEGYAWLIAVTFGMTLLDILYARVLRASNAAVDPALIFSEVSDVLLWLGSLSFLAAIAAIGAAWRAPAARYLFAASLAIVMAGALIPAAIFIPFPDSSLATVPGAGWWIRLSISGAASLLAFLGLRAFHRQ